MAHGGHHDDEAEIDPPAQEPHRARRQALPTPRAAKAATRRERLAPWFRTASRLTGVVGPMQHAAAGGTPLRSGGLGKILVDVQQHGEKRGAFKEGVAH